MKSETIRVAQIMGKMNSGGVESVVMNYYRNINKDNIQFDFIVDEDSSNIPYDQIELLGGNIILIPPYQKAFRYQRELKKVLKKGKYQIVHSHISTMSLFSLCAAKRVGIPIRIAHSHSTTNKAEWKKNIMKQILKPFSKLYATHYFACSELSGRWLFGNRTFNKRKVFIINNAIDLSEFSYDEKVRKLKREELQIEDEEIVIGHIGRFVKQKNHDFLIDIFKEIHTQNNKTVLFLVGEGPLQKEIKSKVKDLGLLDSVRFLGQRNDVNDLYQVFDAFLLPSLYEGLPMVGVEAQASGLLCILSEDTTKETKVLKSTKFISLSSSIKIWAKEVLETLERFRRVDTKNEISKSGFNIKIEVSKLEKIYIDLYKTWKVKNEKN